MRGREPREGHGRARLRKMKVKIGGDEVRVLRWAEGVGGGEHPSRGKGLVSLRTAQRPVW